MQNSFEKRRAYIQFIKVKQLNIDTFIKQGMIFLYKNKLNIFSFNKISMYLTFYPIITN